MAKICISGYYGFKNFGDETILSVLINHFKSHDITVFSFDPKYTYETYKVNSIKSFDIKKVVECIKNSDILISGGGSLLQDATSLKSLVYYVAIIALAILFNKKVIIFAQGIGPINNKFAQIIVKNLLKLCNLVTVRDENSLSLLRNWGIDAIQVCDPVYSLDLEPSNSENIIGIQLRDFKTMNDNLLQKLALLVVTKFSDKKIQIFSLQESLDLAVCKRFEKILKAFNPELETEIVTDDILQRLSKLDILIGMRFHAILCALKCGVKTCAINYDIKVEKLAKDAGLPIISMNAKENMEEIFQDIQKLNRNSLLSFANSKTFKWSKFDNLCFISK